MLSFKKKFLASAILVLALLIGWHSSEAGQSEPDPNAAPGFALKDLKGEVHRLADLKGKVVILNFFAT